jgi:ABC-type dipeptide/oligopeptide/nickel transport system ATPase component
MIFNIQIPTFVSQTNIAVEAGSSVIFVGANGSGKTRLAVLIEQTVGEAAHRISAHRALNLNPNVPKIRGVDALRKLRFGHEDARATVAWRNDHRWIQSNPAVAMLNDFDSLLQALFADQSVATLETHTKYRSGKLTAATATKFETLSEIWHRLLPYKKLIISGDDIRVEAAGSTELYPASQLSDGERAIFYLIAQALVAADSSLLVIDEPELHVHPSIMSSLWDEIEAARKDCAFLFITHDLQFAAARAGQKYVIESFTLKSASIGQEPTPEWAIEPVLDDTGFSEEISTLILGSRRPVLFVEGDGTSFDLAIYRCCYPQWTVIPRGSCEHVIHSVVTMRANAQLTRVKCAGVVDADDYSAEDIARLNGYHVFPLPVSEVENLILLPDISRAIAQFNGFSGAELERQLSELKSAIFGTLATKAAIDDVVVRYCRRRIDRALKRLDLSDSKSINDLHEKYLAETSNLNVQDIAAVADKKIQAALTNNDLNSLLTIYDNKGLFALAAKYLRQTKKDAFEAWITRILRDETSAPNLVAALRKVLPSFTAV